MAQTHLEEFFNNAQFEDLNQVDLCLLMIYCFEDRLLEIGEVTSAIAMKWIKDSKITDDVSIPNLITLAKIRLGFKTFAQEIRQCLEVGSTKETWIGNVHTIFLAEGSFEIKVVVVVLSISLSLLL